MMRYLLVIACAMLAVGGCQRAKLTTPQEQQTVKTLTSDLKSHCVGRYLIDMPSGMTLFSTTKVNGVDIESTPMSYADYQKAMQSRGEALKTEKSRFGYQFLYMDSTIAGIHDSRYFVSLGDPDAMTDASRLVEVYRWVGGYQIKMQIKGYAAKDSQYYKRDIDGRDDPAMNDFRAKSQQVVSLLEKARGRADDEIPTEPGMCFRGGFLAGQQRDSERVETHFVFPKYIDVSFSLETNTDIHDNTTLLQRAQDINAAIGKDPLAKSLRHGSVALQGMKSEEWLAKGTTFFGVLGFMFSMEANTLPGRDPLVGLDMRVGSPSALTGNMRTIEKASLTEGEAIALWDVVSRTLRPRLNAF